MELNGISLRNLDRSVALTRIDENHFEVRVHLLRENRVQTIGNIVFLVLRKYQHRGFYHVSAFRIIRPHEESCDLCNRWLSAPFKNCRQVAAETIVTISTRLG
jgi:hypothetical protein